MFNAKKIVPIFLVIAFLGHTKIYADDIAAQAREIKTKFENSVVIVKLVVKQKMAMQGREIPGTEKQAAITGTIIDPSGLTVVSLTASDTFSLVSNMIKASNSPQAADFKYESEISDIKIRLQDGQEIPAKIVLRDKDLDLAFIEPSEKPASALPSVNIKDTASPQILDQVVSISRLSKLVSWNSYAAIGRIEAIINNPRTIYIPGEDAFSRLGAPAFSPDGKFIGIFVLRTGASDIANFSNSSSIDLNISNPGAAGFMPVILPASDISETAKQILEPQAEEKK